MKVPPRTLWAPSDLDIAQARFDAGERYDGRPWRTVARNKGKREQKIRSLIMGLGFAKAQGEVNPWHALLHEVSRAATRCAYLDDKIDRLHQTDEDLLPGGTAHAYIVLQREERRRLAEASRIAIAAGLAKMQIETTEQEAMIMVSAARYALDQISVTDDQRDLFMEAMTRKMVELEDQANGRAPALVHNSTMTLEV